MQKYGLIRFNGQIHRILALADQRTLLMNCTKLAMPVWVDSSLISGCEACTEDDLSAMVTIADFESLSAEKKKLAHKRYTMIASVLAFVADDYMRTKAITQAAAEYGVTKQTIRRYLYLFLAFKRLEALVQAEKSTGKALSLDEKNFRWAINKFYYSSAKHTLIQARMNPGLYIYIYTVFTEKII